MNTDWNILWPVFTDSVGRTLWMVAVTMIFGGFFGLLLGILLHTTRPGELLANSPIHTALNVLVSLVRPIPFIIFVTAMVPLPLKVVGTTLGTAAAAFPLIRPEALSRSSSATPSSSSP